MNICVGLIVILSVFCGKNAKIIHPNNLDLSSNSVPLSLDLNEAHNNFEGDSSVKKDMYVEKYKGGLKMEVKPYSYDDGAKIPVKIIAEDDGIERELRVGDLDDKSKADVINFDDLNVSEEELRITNMVLSKIREMLENDELQSGRKGAEYKVYVPISEDMVIPDFIPQGLRGSANPVKKDGLSLIDLEGRPQA